MCNVHIHIDIFSENISSAWQAQAKHLDKSTKNAKAETTFCEMGCKRSKL